MNARRAAALLAGTVLALAVALVVLLLRHPSFAPEELKRAALADEEIRRAAIEELTSQAGLYDAHPDHEVGRVLQRGIEGLEFRGMVVSTNRQGFREAEHPWTKRDGTVRVVLLGDSFVFGWGVRPEERLGAFLRAQLESHATGFGGTIECLHLGVPSWNIEAETSFLRRNLGDLRPDLVVHLVVSNDLNDMAGVRGSGALGRFSRQAPEQADALADSASPPEWWDGIREANPLPLGLDFESRERLRLAAEDLSELASAVEEAGGRYLLLAWWSHPSVVHKYLATGLAEDQVVYMSTDFVSDTSLQNDENDYHWNPVGHERAATLTYGIIVQRDLLPALRLTAWPEAAEEVRRIHEVGLEQAKRDPELRAPRSLASELVFGESTHEAASQVYAGVDFRGIASPYVSLVLRAAPEDRRLQVEGRGLGRPELAGKTARVFVEELPVGQIPLEGADRFQLDWPLPPEVQGRPFLNVRFLSDDFVHLRASGLRCASFRLERLRVGP